MSHARLEPAVGGRAAVRAASHPRPASLEASGLSARLPRAAVAGVGAKGPKLCAQARLKRGINPIPTHGRSPIDQASADRRSRQPSSRSTSWQSADRARRTGAGVLGTRRVSSPSRGTHALLPPSRGSCCSRPLAGRRGAAPGRGNTAVVSSVLGRDGGKTTVGRPEPGRGQTTVVLSSTLSCLSSSSSAQSPARGAVREGLREWRTRLGHQKRGASYGVRSLRSAFVGRSQTSKVLRGQDSRPFVALLPGLCFSSRPRGGWARVEQINSSLSAQGSRSFLFGICGCALPARLRRGAPPGFRRGPPGARVSWRPAPEGLGQGFVTPLYFPAIVPVVRLRYPPMAVLALARLSHGLTPQPVSRLANMI